MNHEIKPENLAKALIAGNAMITVQSNRTGVHKTYHIYRVNDTYLRVKYGAKHGKILGNIRYVDVDPIFFSSRSDEETRAFEWLFRNQFNIKKLSEQVKLYHDGSCLRCGRRLTTPESIESGYGPKCIKHV